MQLLQLTPVKSFMNQLLSQETFDSFLMTEATIITNIETTIDGGIHKDYYDSPQDAHSAGEFVLWKNTRGIIKQLILGPRSPLKMHIVLRLSDENLIRLLQSEGISIPPDQIAGLYVNIHFNGRDATCTTGCSLKTFSLDKSLEQAWDRLFERFLQTRQITYEKP